MDFSGGLYLRQVCLFLRYELVLLIEVGMSGKVWYKIKKKKKKLLVVSVC